MDFSLYSMIKSLHIGGGENTRQKFSKLKLFMLQVWFLLKILAEKKILNSNV